MSTATRRIKELEKALAERDRIIAGLVEYAERAESLGCAFAFDVSANYANEYDVVASATRDDILKSFERARAEAGVAGLIFGGGR